jgi:hypothetical protein
MPFDLKEYEDKKKFFIGKTKHSKLEVAHMRQRDLLTYIVRNRLGWTYEQIGKELEKFGEDTYGIDAVMRSIRNAERIINDAKYLADGEEEPAEDLNREVALKQDVEFVGLEEGEVEKVREQETTPYGVEYDNASLNSKDWAPVVKVGEKNPFIVKNSAEGVNIETIDEEKLAMDAIKMAEVENMGSVAFSSSGNDPVFDQSKIDKYKVRESEHKSEYKATNFDNSSDVDFDSDETDINDSDSNSDESDSDEDADVKPKKEMTEEERLAFGDEMARLEAQYRHY